MNQKSKMQRVIEFLILNPQFLEQIESQNHRRIALPGKYEKCAYTLLSYYFEEEIGDGSLSTCELELEKIGVIFSPAQRQKDAFLRALCKLDFDTDNCLKISN
jgi:hypothetical protein